MSSSHLKQLIFERIQREGPISFAEYMRMALYEPGYGYYMAGPAKMGWEGDYYTSSDVSTLFAHCMGRQLYQMWEKLRYPAHFGVLEQGAGCGHLARDVQAWAAQEAPDLFAALDYRTQDIRMGQDVVSSAHERVGTRDMAPSRSATTMINDKPQTMTVILSNELIDAFPVHIVETRDQQLYEVYVDVQAGHFCEVLAEPGTPEVANYLDSYKIPWRSFGDGWRAEINMEALRWMQRTAGLIRHGFILVIDYGDKARRLYTRYRREGTLTCYFQHQLSERPLLRPGEQDITARVNFSALMNEGRRQGLRLNTFTTQRLWLESLGMYDELERIRSSEFAEADTERASNRGQVALLKWYDLRQRVAALTDLAGMGNFKVLILRR